MTNRIQFNAIDIVPAFATPLYITNSEVSNGFKQHCRTLVYDSETGKTIQRDVAEIYRAWHVLIHQQLEYFLSNFLACDIDAFEYKLGHNYCRKVKPGMEIDFQQNISHTLLTGLYFMHKPDCTITFESPWTSWHSVSPKWKFLADNPLNSNKFSYQPEEGTFMIYPSTINCSLSNNNCEQDGYMLQFYVL